jgi:ABC-type Fe3+/spermidine/putrescine transport system ATPase subunit
MSPSQFALRSVSHRYDSHVVLDAVSLTLTAGEHTAILGPSGSGKSTVLRLCAGLEAPSAGHVLVDGRVVSEPQHIVCPPHQRGVAMVFQDLALWPNLSVVDNVLLGLSGTRLTKPEAQTRAYAALSLCAIASLAQRKPGVLSGGEQQRVALARALAVQPAFLLLDEPFAGLDLVTKTKLLEEITALAEAQQLTIVLVTHDPLEATTLCQSALLLENGHVEGAGTWKDLLGNPRSELLTAFRTWLSRAELNL